MLIIKIDEKEMFNSKTQEFIKVKKAVLRLEHSLISISKWESKWHKPFLIETEKTGEELLDYIRCMTLNTDVDPIAYYALTKKDFQLINSYIDNKYTATFFNDDKNALPKVNKNIHSKRRHGEIITSELIYYWMIAYQIPIECEKWHIGRLLTLIKICNIKNEPEKKMGKKELMKRNADLNAARRKQYNSKG